jgi:hypothetical protein
MPIIASSSHNGSSPSSQPHGIDASRSASPIQKKAQLSEISGSPETGLRVIKRPVGCNLCGVAACSGPKTGWEKKGNVMCKVVFYHCVTLVSNEGNLAFERLVTD